ncbi:MAG TPA: c-type cytochrome [bacterium]|nr:c-type cytochrome [bacterium]HMW32976.1 c-type cytochrome [bacterium]HMW35584.1 c-type cytochrome [bacterium]HMY35503.1 c-type cytochrome [bacterium]HMZ04175.1 c-type cytochrome [bacterium]
MKHDKMRFVLILSLIFSVMQSCEKEKINEDAQIAYGRKLFNDTKFSGSGQLSCGTCHPQGDMDNEQWHLDLIHDSLGGVAVSYSTPTLFGVAETAPYLWKGQGGSDLDTLTKTVITGIMGGTATDEEIKAIGAYMRSLDVPANPFRNDDGSLTTEQARGKIVFENQGKCNICHSGETLSGKFSIQIKAARPAFDVPSLRWVFATAPYWHDGSAGSLRAVINHYADTITTAQMTTWKWNGAGQVTPKPIFDIELTEQEKNDLIEYLKTL